MNRRSTDQPSAPTAPRAPRRAHPVLALTLTALIGTLCSGAAVAKDPERLRLRALAATCAQCHGTEGQAVEGQAMVRLAGLPENYILTQLMAFRSGQRPATIMHQITKGYSPEQLESLAKFFSSHK
ncbi:putative cytochrome c [Leptothrix cholodnii SP-6]|uniref:Putative cytochrome c n=1 Tax=Leptothrix cholodnii (strain ATCC 51168 / LMG 8142 / SP-6) TaxID=395495 RepID=B1Y6J7_LEPCP|nr:c-type cytochrome [Leptothrix cholodnii]ACB36025.1 putative cytochrome c [Leptothrix cholodnii SP-6]